MSQEEEEAQKGALALFSVAAHPVTEAAPRPASVDRPPAESAQCTNVDYRTRCDLSARVLQCVAAQVVHHSAVNAEQALVELRKVVLPPGAEVRSESHGLFGLESVPFGMSMLCERIERVATKKNLTGAIALAFSKETTLAKIQAKAAELDGSGAFSAELRDKLAAVLVRHYDVKHAHHCTFDLTGCSAEEARRHSELCRFRDMRCTHSGCAHLSSAHDMAHHVKECGFALVPCQRGCGAQIAKSRMAEHVDGNCGRRPTTCPFAHIGCGVSCTQAELAAHLAEHSTQHLLLALRQIDAQSRVLDATRSELAEASARSRAAETECASYRAEIAALRKDVSAAVHKESVALVSVQKQAAILEAHVRKVDTAVSKLGAAHATTIKELKATAARVHAVKADVDASLNR
jgi:hypothetical protein